MFYFVYKYYESEQMCKLFIDNCTLKYFIYLVWK